MWHGPGITANLRVATSSFSLSCTHPLLQFVLTTYIRFSSPLREGCLEVYLISSFYHFQEGKRATENKQKVICNGEKALFRHDLMIMSAAGPLKGHQPSGTKGLFLCAKTASSSILHLTF